MKQKSKKAESIMEFLLISGLVCAISIPILVPFAQKISLKMENSTPKKNNTEIKAIPNEKPSLPTYATGTPTTLTGTSSSSLSSPPEVPSASTPDLPTPIPEEPIDPTPTDPGSGSVEEPEPEPPAEEPPADPPQQLDDCGIQEIKSHLTDYRDRMLAEETEILAAAYHDSRFSSSEKNRIMELWNDYMFVDSRPGDIANYVESAGYPKYECINQCYDSSVNVSAAIDYPHDKPDSTLCTIFWHQEEYGITDYRQVNPIQNEARSRGLGDPYEVEINGETYVFVQDKDKSGFFDSIKEILGFTDTTNNLFKEMRSLDANSDGSVDTQELISNNIKLLKVKNGKLTKQEYSLNNIKAISLNKFVETDDKSKATGLYGKFQLELVDNTILAGKETFKEKSILQKLIDGVKDIFWGVVDFLGM